MARISFIDIWGDYLQILCCPECTAIDSNLIHKHQGGKEYLTCSNCAARYDIVNGVPILLSREHANPLGQGKSENDGQKILSATEIIEGISDLEDWKFLSYQYYTRHREFMKSTLSFDSNGIVLDIGCAGGSLASSFKKYIGLDTSWKLISFAHSYLDKPFVLADARRMPFKSKSISYFISRNMLEHTTEDNVIIKEAVRVCKEHGVFELPCSDGVSVLIDPINVIRRKIGLKPKPIFSYGFGHINMQTEKEWERRLTYNGFIVGNRNSLGHGLMYKLFSFIEFILFSFGDNDDIPAKYIKKKNLRLINRLYDCLYKLDPKTKMSWSRVFYVTPKA